MFPDCVGGRHDNKFGELNNFSVKLSFKYVQHLFSYLSNMLQPGYMRIAIWYAD